MGKKKSNGQQKQQPKKNVAENHLSAQQQKQQEPKPEDVVSSSSSSSSPDLILEHNQHRHSFLAPFVLGFSIALILILVPLLSGIYWSCKDVDSLSTNDVQQQCPLIISTSSSRTL